RVRALRHQGRATERVARPSRRDAPTGERTFRAVRPGRGGRGPYHGYGGDRQPLLVPLRRRSSHRLGPGQGVARGGRALPGRDRVPARPLLSLARGVRTSVSSPSSSPSSAATLTAEGFERLALPAAGGQQPPDMAGVIPTPELPLDHLGHAREGPEIR